jgi:hypothetical protein
MKVASIYDLKKKQALGGNEYSIVSSLQSGKRVAYDNKTLFRVLEKLLSSEHKLKTTLCCSCAITGKSNNIFSLIVDKNIADLQKIVNRVSGGAYPRIAMEITASELRSPLLLLKLNNKNISSIAGLLKNSVHDNIAEILVSIASRNNEYIKSCEDKERDENRRAE